MHLVLHFFVALQFLRARVCIGAGAGLPTTPVIQKKVRLPMVRDALRRYSSRIEPVAQKPAYGIGGLVPRNPSTRACAQERSTGNGASNVMSTSHTGN
jgi:hypothetical protein